MVKHKVVVLGASGFIGRNLFIALRRNPSYEVIGTYRNSLSAGVLEDPERRAYVRVDLTHQDEVDGIVGGADIVIQAAATTSGAKEIVTKPYLHVADNAVMNSLIFRSCFNHKVKHLVFFSCTVMYPSQPEPVRESDLDYRITDKYFAVGWTKLYLEKMCEFYSRISSTKYTVIRHSNIYGPYDKFDLEKSHVLGATVTKVMTAAENSSITVWGDGSEARDLLYVDDLVEFVERILAGQTVPFELVNVGSGEAISVGDLVQKIMDHSGKRLAIAYDRKKPTIPFNLRLNVDRAKSLYGWVPRTSLDEGVRKTLEWYRSHCAGGEIVPQLADGKRGNP